MDWEPSVFLKKLRQSFSKVGNLIGYLISRLLEYFRSINCAVDGRTRHKNLLRFSLLASQSSASMGFWRARRSDMLQYGQLPTVVRYP
jgi:hypothetical protein